MAGLKGLIKLPQPIQRSAITAGYTAAGMLGNRFVAARLIAMFNVDDANMQLGLRVLSGIGIGVVAFQLAKQKEIATAMTIGALADVLVEVWNGFAPEGLKFAGGNLGLMFAEKQGLNRQLPGAVSEISQFAGNGLGLQSLEVQQMI